MVRCKLHKCNDAPYDKRLYISKLEFFQHILEGSKSMTEERFKQTSYKMSFEEYKKCDCTECDKTDCIHRNAYRRMPGIDGGLGLCPNLKGVRA